MTTLRVARIAPLLVLTASVACAVSPCEAAHYAFDQKRTVVLFACDIGLGTQRGRFTSVEGQVDYEPQTPDQTKVSARVATTSLTTGEPIMDDVLKGSDFFNVHTHPRMTFVSRSVRATGSQAAVMQGDITVNGITRPVKLAVSIAAHESKLKYAGTALEFVARTRIKRSAFNMTAYASMASDDVDIEIDALLRKTP